MGQCRYGQFGKIKGGHYEKSNFTSGFPEGHRCSRRGGPVGCLRRFQLQQHRGPRQFHCCPARLHPAAMCRSPLWTYPIGSWGGTESKLDDIIAAFNAVHPEITVTYETLDYQNGDNLVTSAITANETPDIIMEGPERLVTNWGANNLMVDLSDLWSETEEDIAAVSESVVSACKLNDAYYEYPPVHDHPLHGHQL